MLKLPNLVVLPGYFYDVPSFRRYRAEDIDTTTFAGCINPPVTFENFSMKGLEQKVFGTMYGLAFSMWKKVSKSCAFSMLERGYQS